MKKYAAAILAWYIWILSRTLNVFKSSFKCGMVLTGENKLQTYCNAKCVCPLKPAIGRWLTCVVTYKSRSCFILFKGKLNTIIKYKWERWNYAVVSIRNIVMHIGCCGKLLLPNNTIDFIYRAFLFYTIQLFSLNYLTGSTHILTYIIFELLHGKLGKVFTHM